jgi:hypothetical protein
MKQAFAIVGLLAFCALFVISLLVATGTFTRKDVFPFQQAHSCACKCDACDCSSKLLGHCAHNEPCVALECQCGCGCACCDCKSK